MNASMIPARVPAPGRIIRRELDARGWTQKDLGDIMGRPEQTISQIVNARKRITPDTALQLAAAFQTSPDLWLGLEMDYQLHLARKDQDLSGVERKRRLYTRVPLSEMVRRGWIEDRETLDDQELEVCAFLEIASLHERPAIAMNLRQSDAYDPEIVAQTAWVKRVERLARQQAVCDFDLDRLRRDLPQLLRCAQDVADVARVPDFLCSHGVHFLMVPHLDQTYMDGAAFTVQGHPVVALTLRYDRIDHFWFTLLHELAHILAEHPGGYLDHLDEPAEGADEIEANHLAQTWLMDEHALAQFVAATRPYFSHDKIKAFAAQIQRHPGIVVGRLQHDEILGYQHARRFLVKVSPYLSMLT